MTDFFQAGSVQLPPKGANALYAKSSILRPVQKPCRTEYRNKLWFDLADQVRCLNYGQGTYRGFTKEAYTERPWYDHKRVPHPVNFGEYFYKGNSVDWSVCLLVRCVSIGIERGALSLAKGYYGPDSHLRERARQSTGHMVLIIHSTAGDIVACSITHLSWFGSNQLQYHTLTQMEYGPDWVSVDDQVMEDAAQ